MSLLVAHHLSKRYSQGPLSVDVLVDVEFRLEVGELVGIYGASGAGKSTLLHLLGGLDEPTGGEILFADRNLLELRGDERARLRNRSIGFVFQFYHLLSEFSALENVMIPCLISGMKRSEASDRAHALLVEVGLEHRLQHRPGELSGGEQQRVALSRAAVMSPAVILADEPTGNLDRQTGERVFAHLLSLNTKRQMAIVMVTHNRELLATCPKQYELRDGRLVAGGTPSR